MSRSIDGALAAAGAADEAHARAARDMQVQPVNDPRAVFGVAEAHAFETNRLVETATGGGGGFSSSAGKG